MPIITHLVQVILTVQNMAAQVAFYRDTLGLPIKDPANLPDYSNEYWVEFQTGDCTLALHGGGQSRVSPDAPRISFNVTDITSARQNLIAQGVPLSEIRSPAPNIHVCDAQDPEGNIFSLWSSSQQLVGSSQKLATSN